MVYSNWSFIKIVFKFGSISNMVVYCKSLIKDIFTGKSHFQQAYFYRYNKGCKICTPILSQYTYTFNSTNAYIQNIFELLSVQHTTATSYIEHLTRRCTLRTSTDSSNSSHVRYFLPLFWMFFFFIIFFFHRRLSLLSCSALSFLISIFFFF